ncbi:hypothetical protein OROGR_001065 [Orobanche gracilis]
MYPEQLGNTDPGRTGENLMQPENQQQPPPRRRQETQMSAQNHQNHHQPPPPPQKCPRCDSSNTKFCYYNNYSLSQPRYFCKSCRRYWTHGGTLRNVPVGGGCRKSKRSKSSTPSSSSGGEIARTHGLPSAGIVPPQNLTGMVPVQGLRASSMPSMGSNSFYTGGTFLSSLAAMQSFPPGINPASATANFGAGSSHQYDGNMALLQSLKLPHHQAQNDQVFPSQQSLNMNHARPALNSWTQTFIRGSADPSSGYWSRASDEGENQAGSNSFSSSQWTGSINPGFNPSR